MAGISDNLEIFRKLSKKHYNDLLSSLEEKYCWKCPMRTNSSETYCREVDSWVRLSIAFEMGIHDELMEMEIPNNCLEVLTAKYIEKLMKNGITNKLQKLTMFKTEQNMGFGVNTGDYLVVKHDPQKLKSGDMVLFPNSCPLSNLWFTKISMDELPLKIFSVKKIFHRAGVKYIQTVEDFEVPLEYVYGIIVKVIKQEDPIFSELHLNRL